MVDSAVATTTVNITAVDDAPVAQPDAFTITEIGHDRRRQSVRRQRLGRGQRSGRAAAHHLGGERLGRQRRAARSRSASGALLTVNSNGTFNYDPNGAFLPTPTAGSGASNTPAPDSFTYTLAGGNTVTVTLTVRLDTDDILLGTSGTDMLAGGNGADTMTGFAGNDTYLRRQCRRRRDRSGGRRRRHLCAPASAMRSPPGSASRR